MHMSLNRTSATVSYNGLVEKAKQWHKRCRAQCKGIRALRKRKCGTSGVGQTPLRKWHDVHDLGKWQLWHFGHVFHRLDKHGNGPTAKSKGSVVSKELGGLRVRASETYNVYLIVYMYTYHVQFNVFSAVYICFHIQRTT